MDMRRQQRNQVAEHVRRRGKAMQQQDGRRGWRPRLPVKNVESIQIVPPVENRCVMNGHAELLGCAAGITGRRVVKVVETVSLYNHLTYILTVISTIG